MREPTPSEIGAASALATMGALPLGIPSVSEQMAAGDESPSSPLLYAVGAVGGASLGGGLVGLVASGDLRGAVTGGLMTGSLAAVADGLALARDGRKTLGTALGLLGLGGVAAGLFLAATRERR